MNEDGASIPLCGGEYTASGNGRGLWIFNQSNANEAPLEGTKTSYFTDVTIQDVKHQPVPVDAGELAKARIVDTQNSAREP